MIADPLLGAARVVTGLAFLVIGIRNIGNHHLLAGLMMSRRLPAPSLCAAVGISMQIGFGALMLTGIYPTVAAIGLAAFVVLATAIAHSPFGKTGAERQAEITAILANAIMLGGLIALAAAGLR